MERDQAVMRASRKPDEKNGPSGKDWIAGWEVQSHKTADDEKTMAEQVAYAIRNTQFRLKLSAQRCVLPYVLPSYRVGVSEM